ncbi:hypothetical protein FKM82_009100 [Ascaphus truei]
MYNICSVFSLTSSLQICMHQSRKSHYLGSGNNQAQALFHSDEMKGSRWSSSGLPCIDHMVRQLVLAVGPVLFQPVFPGASMRARILPQRLCFSKVLVREHNAPNNLEWLTTTPLINISSSSSVNLRLLI